MIMLSQEVIKTGCDHIAFEILISLKILFKDKYKNSIFVLIFVKFNTQIYFYKKKLKIMSHSFMKREKEREREREKERLDYG
mmetsp:Transcript_2040/g.4081  ORF Transcript_2040/g.4081 Transcript_2040/m.4081 type:complete len:82 (+) Transcript_2040:28-273(+)